MVDLEISNWNFINDQINRSHIFATTNQSVPEPISQRSG